MTLVFVIAGIIAVACVASAVVLADESL